MRRHLGPPREAYPRDGGSLVGCRLWGRTESLKWLSSSSSREVLALKQNRFEVEEQNPVWLPVGRGCWEGHGAQASTVGSTPPPPHPVKQDSRSFPFQEPDTPAWGPRHLSSLPHLSVPLDSKLWLLSGCLGSWSQASQRRWRQSDAGLLGRWP